VYFDNAATSQKPRAVIDRITAYYQTENSNVHRGVHTLSQWATDAYEAGRASVQRFINARHSHEIIFTRGTTESINLVATSFGRARIGAGDNVVISTLEHHSNIVPWQLICEEKGASLRVVPVSEAGVLDLDAYGALLDERTRIVAISHISNALGTINPVRSIIEEAHRRGIPVLLDSAQAVPHEAVDVQALDVDFCAFSGHK
ncbi:MAG: aminotransferase class V-fold PLP-dependent enzyme, partial [Dehalococcoidia bacterium]|nr:aminotransferase class V-fold PLP-dependent enzyme [Dehalococcoidia bacterium]